MANQFTTEIKGKSDRIMLRGVIYKPTGYECKSDSFLGLCDFRLD